MNFVKKIFYFSIIWLNFITVAYMHHPDIELIVDHIFVFDEINAIDEELTKAIYEFGLLSGIARNPSIDYLKINSNNIVIKELLEKISTISSLMNFVCAQVYVNHLKDLRDITLGQKTPEDIDITNHFNKNPPSINSRLTAASRQGTASALKLIENGNIEELNAVVSQSLNHLSSYLCAEFELSYRKLFEIDDHDKKSFHHPYHSLFCDIFLIKDKDPLNEELKK